MLGFVGNDLIYGFGKEKDSWVVNGRMKGLPMYAMYIADNQMNVQSEYRKDGIFIGDVMAEDGRIHLKCSPEVKTVVFNSNMPWAAERVQEVADGEAFYRYGEQDRYIRIELLDQEGRMAWSSPYPVR